MTVPVTLVTPFQDPPNTFRASSIADMFRVVPSPGKYWNALRPDVGTLRQLSAASFIYDVGINPKVRSLIFTFQNRTISHTLRVELILPSYLRSDLGNVFDIPHRGDTETPPVAVLTNPSPTPVATDFVFSPKLLFSTIAPSADFVGTSPASGSEQWQGSGKGLINVLISFSETQAQTFVPGTFEDAIIFKVTPLNVAGPVFVDESAPIPVDLNEVVGEDDTVPRDDDVVTPEDEEPMDKGVVEVPVFIDREVEVTVEVNKWIDGTDGQSKDWPPPTGWEVGNDGRMYPPVPDPEVCEVTTGTERDIEDIPEEERTPLEQLLFESKDIPPTFGGDTRRRGYIIDLDPILEGFNTGRVTGRTIELLVADSDDDDVGFKIINWKTTFRNGQQVPDPTTNEEMRAFFEKSNLWTGYLKQGVTIPGAFFNPDAIVTRTLKQLLEEGTKLSVKSDDDENDIRRHRLWGNVMTLVKDIETNGEGKPV